jgi:hypothetical protein
MMSFVIRVTRGDTWGREAFLDFLTLHKTALRSSHIYNPFPAS